ncbi:hypothetical protein [Granulicella sibirica]|uniref:ATPase AAA-type core domain-containing protein n=1 Tax=Granulicella sibirica TaxID=2479048 RepID=A0A4Q0T309_9BACT|nr:hypothetical protein [Granulicella sibirica]RXH58075.1 hypothetical protein GRAN_1385 [Granulicella sibirica]
MSDQEKTGNSELAPDGSVSDAELDHVTGGISAFRPSTAVETVAPTSSSVLLFDEADSLFGKRTTVTDSHDRYANP